MSNNKFQASDSGADAIRATPEDLRDRLLSIDERMTALRGELAEVRGEFVRLSQHPEALEQVDTSGNPIAATAKVDRAIRDLEWTDARLNEATFWTSYNAQAASRLQLTEQAAVELDQRRGERAPIERTR